MTDPEPTQNITICTGEESFTEMEVVCDSQGIHTSVSVCAFRNINMPLDTVHLDPSEDEDANNCTWTMENGFIHFNILFESDGCGTKDENNGTHMHLRLNDKN